MQAEVPKTPYPIGSVAWAKTGSDPDGTAGSQFFIGTGQSITTLPLQYGIIGTVTKGLDVAQKIEGFAPVERRRRAVDDQGHHQEGDDRGVRRGHHHNDRARDVVLGPVDRALGPAGGLAAAQGGLVAGGVALRAPASRLAYTVTRAGTRHEPGAARFADQRRLLVDPDQRRGRGEQVDRALAEMVGGGAVVREDGEVGDEAQPDGVRAPRGSTIGSQSECGARAGRGDDRAAWYAARIESYRAEPLRTERRCSGEPSAM